MSQKNEGIIHSEYIFHKKITALRTEHIYDILYYERKHSRYFIGFFRYFFINSTVFLRFQLTFTLGKLLLLC